MSRTSHPPRTGPHLSTGMLLGRVGSEARKSSARVLAGHGLRLHHYAALLVLDGLAASSQQRLGTMIGVDPRNLVPIIDVLEHRGLIARRSDPGDRRRHQVALTPAGADLLRQARTDTHALEQELLCPLTASEQDTLHRLLLKLLPAATENNDRCD